MRCSGAFLWKSSSDSRWTTGTILNSSSKQQAASSSSTSQRVNTQRKYESNEVHNLKLPTHSIKNETSNGTCNLCPLVPLPKYRILGVETKYRISRGRNKIPYFPGKNRTFSTAFFFSPKNRLHRTGQNKDLARTDRTRM